MDCFRGAASRAICKNTRYACCVTRSELSSRLMTVEVQTIQSGDWALVAKV